MTAHSVLLGTPQATMNLGAFFANFFTTHGQYPLLLLNGPLGSGKTTFVQGLVQALPGGQAAEICSPSFNLVNIYPTTPETAHFDLYRLSEQSCFDESLIELLERERLLCVVEWSEFMPKTFLPSCYLELSFKIVSTGRDVTINTYGDLALLNMDTLNFSLAP